MRPTFVTRESKYIISREAEEKHTKHGKLIVKKCNKQNCQDEWLLWRLVAKEGVSLKG